ncbi:uncharacterized protein CDAR_287891 [Caerostris darwini]|uniref:Uncharacterized protein n=1 Tax=Caerostris darwini TaxID=1538125 RepID=A0AAV4PBP1_9ARAC|nr:uncharacterized protein CDAR_287891 [Caerostris darwini]
MLAILSLVFCAAVFVASREIQPRIILEDNHGSEMVQKPIFYFGEMRSTDLEIGDPCSFSFNCLSGCCLKEKNGKTRCRRKQRKEERCSVGQIKLDMYMDYCPCELGNKFCSEDPEPRCIG